MSHIDQPVDGHGVMAGPDHGPAVSHEAEQARAERLVVVHDVELARPLGQEAPGPQAERAGLGETAREHRPQFHQVGPVPDLAPAGEAERVGLPVQVEARHLDQVDTLVRVDRGPRLAREHGHLMAQAGQLPGQEPGVDPLAPRPRVPPVDEQRHPEALALAGIAWPG